MDRFNSISINKLQTKNNKGQNLLHILSDNMASKDQEILIEKIFDILTNKIKLKINEFDNENHTPLYYAVSKKNFKMINLLTDNMNKNNFYLFLQRDEKNEKNKSPLMLLYDIINSKNENNFFNSNEIKLLKICFEVTKETKIGYFSNVAKYLINNYKTNYKNLFDIKKINNQSDDEMTIITNLYLYLINECKISIMTEIDEEGNDIFIGAAFKNNYDFFKDILIKEKNINFRKTNKNQKSLIHTIISPYSFFSYQNKEFLKTAINCGFDTSLKDKDGFTPLDYAEKYNYNDMIEILGDKENKKEKNKIKDEMEIEEENDINNINYDYKLISQKYYDETVEPYITELNNKDKEDNSKLLVSRNCGLTIDNYLVYKDNNGILYNVNLSKVDISRYLYGEFMFYQLQLLINIKKNMYNLITRWGRFGEIGQYQNTPFNEESEAIKEFNKIFSSKTGNNWENIKNNLENFEKIPKKYHLLQLTDKKPEIYNIMQFFNNELNNIYVSIPRENFEFYEKYISPNTQEFINCLVIKSFKCKVRGNNNTNYYNRNNYNDNTNKNGLQILYFEKESLDKAYKILSELGNAIDKMNELRDKKNNFKINENDLNDENSPFNLNKKQLDEIAYKILKLSNQYYEIIPFSDKRDYSISPINNSMLLKKELDFLQSYTYIEDTLKLFLSSLFYKNTIDPIIYIYKALNKKIIPLNLNMNDPENKDKELIKFILNYMKLSNNNYNYNNNIITNIFEIIDNKKEKTLLSKKTENNLRVLLFHGTKTQNLLGILSKGLIIAPIESMSSGSRFGNGIYLSDSFNKSIGYSGSYNYFGTGTNKDKKYVLIVDTILDKIFKVSKNNVFKGIGELKNEGFNCLVNDAYSHMDYNDRIYLKNGTSMPTKFIKEQENNGNIRTFGNSDNYFKDGDTEYVIYDPELVNVKYIIELTNK